MAQKKTSIFKLHDNNSELKNDIKNYYAQQLLCSTGKKPKMNDPLSPD